MPKVSKKEEIILVKISMKSALGLIAEPRCQICYHWNMDSGIVPLEFRVDIILCQWHNIMSFALW